MIIVPFGLNMSPEQIMMNFQIAANRIAMGLEKQPFPNYDLSIDDNAFFEMEITLSPKISAGNRIIVSDLIQKYNPKAILSESVLNGLI